MGKCSCHPDIETNFICLKHNVYLCEGCLTCRDPEIYCKHRSSCPIWFIDKHQKGWDSEKAEEESAKYRVAFNPGKKTVRVSSGTPVLEAAQAADVHINAL
ncbi:MAG: hypothetical protein JRH15_15375 [Deltaproteobacteria bacterium]|nr:hypothetical protein [Deltaproteobacteria bacterium]